jgi:hypothetical protein
MDLRWRTVIASPGSGSAAPVSAHLGLDLVDYPLRLLLASVDEQPARALGHVAADEQDRQAEDRAQPERQPPAHVLGEVGGVEQEQRGHAPRRRPHPVAAVDR